MYAMAPAIVARDATRHGTEPTGWASLVLLSLVLSVLSRNEKEQASESGWTVYDFNQEGPNA